MPGPGQATNQPLQVDTSSLVGRGADPNIVGPAAVDALTGAFHKGFITTDDIMERLSERTKQKQKLELATTNNQLAEANNPDIQAARTNVQLAQGAQAKGQLANADLTQQADAAQKKAAILDADLSNGDFGAMNKALALQGFSVRIGPEGVTQDVQNEIGKRYGALRELTRQQAEAAAKVKDTTFSKETRKTTLANGAETVETVDVGDYQGRRIPPDEFKGWAQKNAELQRTPLSTFYHLFSQQPGQTTAAAPAPQNLVQPAVAPAPVVAPPTPAAIAAANAAPITPEQRAQMVNSGVPVTQASMATNIVQPAPAPVVAAPAQIVAPSTPAVGAVGPTGGIITSVIEAKATEPKAPTEAQQRALLALPRFHSANIALQDLQNKGYDPTSWRSWVGSYLPEIVKTGNRKEYETAVDAWSQGLLRLESGAAINRQEKTWYEKAFFPAPGDPVNVVKQKEAMRHNVEAMVAEEGSAGPISEGLKARARKVFNEAEAYGGPASTGIPFPAGAGATSPDEKIGTAGGVTYVSRIDPTTGRTRLFMRQ